mgnify:FL=1
MEFLCIKDFSQNGLSVGSNSEINHVQGGWKEGSVYSGKYYDGGVMCPTQAYMISAENGNQHFFTLKQFDCYPCFSDYFKIVNNGN